METIKKITGKFQVIQSTSSKLLGYYLEDGAIAGQNVELCKDNFCKKIPVDLIVRVDYNKYHLLNSNIGVIVKRI